MSALVFSRIHKSQARIATGGREYFLDFIEDHRKEKSDLKDDTRNSDSRSVEHAGVILFFSPMRNVLVNIEAECSKLIAGAGGWERKSSKTSHGLIFRQKEHSYFDASDLQFSPELSLCALFLFVMFAWWISWEERDPRSERSR